ncbi:pentatricopeptide repeat-containing protein At4g04790, mitochondrial isoform X2 [Argentina anserina]|uniref:pentatricopeptide repeat-containing protein At4g04790, mitochondrial isoform X2 n=1 Tax=Argentina anserina TaxID=57926 RepID=UPI00217636F0|nr:pentatricopeptide repeat-containing protein At4g04790, mitochondrial isoform X2 [Potentilla anserina]
MILKKFFSKISQYVPASFKHPPSSASASASAAGYLVVAPRSDSFGDISSILQQGAGDRHPHRIDESSQREVEVPWTPNLPTSVDASNRKKEIALYRRQRFNSSTHQNGRFSNLMEMCTSKLGGGTTVEVFKRLGNKSSLQECNALIQKCVDEARVASDEVVAGKHMQIAFQVFESLKERGFPLEEQTYGPYLEYLIDMGMTEEFSSFCRDIKKENPSLLPALGYYEMRLWIRVNDKEKIQELCNGIESHVGENKSMLRVKYLLALFENDRAEEIEQLLQTMDITKFSSKDLVRIFKCLGRPQLESFAEKFLLEIKERDCAAEEKSNLIYIYVVGIPNLAVEDVISKFRNLHTKLEMIPSSESYKELIIHSCNSLKVHVALELVDEMSELGLEFKLDALHPILQASITSCDFNLVHQIYLIINRRNLSPTIETFRIMINLCVRMKDYEGAYRMLSDSKEMNLNPTAAMYNAIMVGYFREKNMSRVSMVLKQMKEAKVEPDSQTFSLLITNCNSEDDINMYYKEMTQSRIQVTKQVFMALVNAYAACGQFEKAKQVLLDGGIPIKSSNEIKSVLVQALASHGQLFDAFSIFEEIKQDGYRLEPKAVISLIEHLQADEDALSKLLLLLDTVEDPNYWCDGCLRTISYCVRYKHLRPAINLIEQLRDQVCTDELTLEVIFDKVFYFIAESESTSLQFGLDLLHAMKSELDLTPSRKCLDFLLHACVSAKDLQSSLFVWKEYQAAGLPYNIISFLRMYQALLATGELKAAKILERKIPKDDLHVRSIIEACQSTYLKKTDGNRVTKKKKKKEKNNIM